MTKPRERSEGDPLHVAIIMDGNGRWAKRQGLPRTAGHEAGARSVERLLRHIRHETDLQYLTLFAFSSENWGRPPAEVRFLMNLLQRFIDDKLEELRSEGVRLRVLGSREELPREVCECVERAIRETARGDALTLCVALNYGARREILEAARAMGAGKASEGADEAALAQHLETHGLPDPDLVIRTGGERRLSNFLLWQIAYAELYFTDIPWPAFGPKEYDAAVEDYRRRTRRFGRIPEASV